MAEGSEHHIINVCKENLAKVEEKCVYGVAMELYEFKEDSAGKAYKEGWVSRPTSFRQIEFIEGYRNQDGHIRMRTQKKDRRMQAKFCTKEPTELAQMRLVLNESLKHSNIVKPLLCTHSEQSLKSVFACANFNYTLEDWLHAMVAQEIPAGDYLSEQGKDIVRSGWTVIHYIWKMGYTCRDLDKPHTYVMVGTSLKILPFFISKRATDDNSSELALRQQFADLLENHIFKYWKDGESKELISLMKHPDASFELILGHPVLVSSAVRELMYRNSYHPAMTQDQLSALNANCIVDADWDKKAKLADSVLQHILKRKFTADAAGALQFAQVVSCHYVQQMKSALLGCNGQLPSGHVDKLLKGCLPLLLCQRYALKLHKAFKSKVIFQL